MNYRSFPKNKDIRVSEVGFGVWSVATKWWGVSDEKLALSLLHHAYDMGINFYDTADIYGNGYGEEILAKAFPRKLFGFRYKIANSFLSLSLHIISKHSLFKQMASFDPTL